MNRVTHAIVVNEDDQTHDLTVRGVVGGSVISSKTVTLGPGEQRTVPVAVPRHQADLEIQAIPDSQADVYAADPITEGIDVPSLPSTTAVTLFGIVAGAGGALGQIIAAQKLASVSAVPLTRVAAASGVAIAGSILGTAIL